VCSSDLMSTKGQGSYLKSTFLINHIDRIPVGNVPESLVLTMISNSNINFKLSLKSPRQEFYISTNDILESLEGVPIDTPEIVNWIKEFIGQNFITVFWGELDEVV
jgi:hypothetical protein